MVERYCGTNTTEPREYHIRNSKGLRSHFSWDIFNKQFFVKEIWLWCDLGAGYSHPNIFPWEWEFLGSSLRYVNRLQQPCKDSHNDSIPTLLDRYVNCHLSNYFGYKGIFSLLKSSVRIWWFYFEFEFGLKNLNLNVSSIWIFALKWAKITHWFWRGENTKHLHFKNKRISFRSNCCKMRLFVDFSKTIRVLALRQNPERRSRRAPARFPERRSGVRSDQQSGAPLRQALRPWSAALRPRSGIIFFHMHYAMGGGLGVTTISPTSLSKIPSLSPLLKPWSRNLTPFQKKKNVRSRYTLQSVNPPLSKTRWREPHLNNIFETQNSGYQ